MLSALLTSLFSSFAWAEGSSQATTFVAATTPAEVPGGPLLLGAYFLFWLLILGYVHSVARRQSEVMDQQRALVAELKELGEPDA